MKQLITLILTVSAIISLTGCHSKEAENTIRVGAMAGPETAIMRTAQDVLKKDYGINMKLITFTSYTVPNDALNSGDLDANYFQHVPYLNSQIKERGYKLSPIGKIFIYPMGIFSKKIQHLNQLTAGDKVGVPNDPSNESRALLLLQQAGLIKLRKGANSNATILDIDSNPKQLKFIALDAAQLPRALSDLTIAVINNTYAIPAGYTLKNALFAEDKHSPYVNVVVVRSSDKNKVALQDLVKAMQSPEVLAKAHSIFGSGVVKGW